MGGLWARTRAFSLVTENILNHKSQTLNFTQSQITRNWIWPSQITDDTSVTDHRVFCFFLTTRKLFKTPNHKSQKKVLHPRIGGNVYHKLEIGRTLNRPCEKSLLYRPVKFGLLKKLSEKFRDCHSDNPQPTPETKRKRKSNECQINIQMHEKHKNQLSLPRAWWSQC